MLRDVPFPPAVKSFFAAVSLANFDLVAGAPVPCYVESTFFDELLATHRPDADTSQQMTDGLLADVGLPGGARERAPRRVLRMRACASSRASSRRRAQNPRDGAVHCRRLQHGWAGAAGHQFRFQALPCALSPVEHCCSAEYCCRCGPCHRWVLHPWPQVGP